MALRPPNTPTQSIPLTQSKKGVFSSSSSLIPSSARRPSTSSVNSFSFSSSPSQGIGFSPIPATPTTPANSSSGIPSFRTLRSLLPFGPNKNATPVSVSVSPNGSTRSPFANFGSVRRSMQKDRERKGSLSNDAAMVPVIAIGKSENSPVAEETTIRRSVSLPRLESLEGPIENVSAFTLRTPSPGPALSAELSTIIEADSSGVSKHVPLLKTISDASYSSYSAPPPEASHSFIQPQASQQRTGPSSSHGGRHGFHTTLASDFEADTSALDLSTTHLADQVLDALRGSESSPNAAKEWRNADKAIVIDADAVGDMTLGEVDPDLAELLSPNSVGKKPYSLQTTRRSSVSQTPSPITPTYPSSPASASRLPRARQASSFLPRLRPQDVLPPSPSPTSPHFAISTPSPTMSMTTPKPSPIRGRTSGSAPTIAVNGHDYAPYSPPTPSSPVSASQLPSTSTPVMDTPIARRLSGLTKPARLFSPSSPSAPVPSPAKRPSSASAAGPVKPATRTLRQVLLGVNRNQRSNASGNESSSPSPSSLSISAVALPMARASLDSRRPPFSSCSDLGLGRPSLEIRRGNSFDSRSRPSYSYSTRTSTSPERDFTTAASTEINSSPSPEIPFSRASEEFRGYRPSLDSNTTATASATSPSSRPSSQSGSAAGRFHREKDRERERMSPVPRSQPSSSARTRKRSMSVQDRTVVGRGRGGPRDGPTRPGSSMSAHGGPGKMEWIGPRTAKAFKAAGLIDFERDRERDREREREEINGSSGGDITERLRSGSVSGVVSPSPLSSGLAQSALNRFASLRSASEYNPSHSRAHSRMAFSDVGGPAGGSAGRRGSGTFSSYGGGPHPAGAGLMDSPTFTVSSGSRGGDRDTPKSSTSTAPTSVLSESFGYLGRERDRPDRDREREHQNELREMRERHGTEMGALLGALSDSQRTVKVLRDENSELRDRIERFGDVLRDNEGLRRICAELREECEVLRRESSSGSGRRWGSPGGLTPSWSSSSAGSTGGLRTPVLMGKGGSSPLARSITPRIARQQEEEPDLQEGGEDLYNATFIDHGGEEIDDDDNSQHFNGGGPLEGVLPPSSTPSLRKRASNTSSIFPVVPANMTMLLHEDSTSNIGGAGDSNRSSADHSQYRFSLPPASAPSSSKPIPQSQSHAHSRTHSRSHSLSQSPPMSYRAFAAGAGHAHSNSVTSASGINISPTTANFSMATGSPGSLFLRPEHEILLGDMESLDLGIRGQDMDMAMGLGLGARTDSDGW